MTERGRTRSIAEIEDAFSPHQVKPYLRILCEDEILTACGAKAARFAALRYFLLATAGAGQKPGSAIARVSCVGAYFLRAGPTAAALPMRTNTRFSAGKCFWIIWRATSGVTASTRASS